MELFNEYYNSELQFLLDLLCLGRPFSRAEADALLKKEYVFAPYNDYLTNWINKGLFEKTRDGKYQVCKDDDRAIRSFIAPLNSLEQKYLFELCNTDEAKFFLPDELRKKFASHDLQSVFDFIKREDTQGKRSSVQFSAELFQTLLRAISQGWKIKYEYCTVKDPTLRPAQGIPYRLEYSAFDGRWWLISYNEEEQRPIKSRLENLKNVQLTEKHNFSKQTIQNAIVEHLAPETVKLRITNHKNALERCFFEFEDMLDMSAFKLGNDEYELRFRYFQWDEGVIVRKLLYLGEYVSVQSPKSIIDKLVRELKICLGH